NCLATLNYFMITVYRLNVIKPCCTCKKTMNKYRKIYEYVYGFLRHVFFILWYSVRKNTLARRFLNGGKENDSGSDCSSDSSLHDVGTGFCPGSQFKSRSE